MSRARSRSVHPRTGWWWHSSEEEPAKLLELLSTEIVISPHRRATMLSALA